MDEIVLMWIKFFWNRFSDNAYKGRSCHFSPVFHILLFSLKLFWKNPLQMKLPTAGNLLHKYTSDIILGYYTGILYCITIHTKCVLSMYNCIIVYIHLYTNTDVLSIHVYTVHCLHVPLCMPIMVCGIQSQACTNTSLSSSGSDMHLSTLCCHTAHTRGSLNSVTLLLKGPTVDIGCCSWKSQQLVEIGGTL